MKIKYSCKQSWNKAYWYDLINYFWSAIEIRQKKSEKQLTTFGDQLFFRQKLVQNKNESSLIIWLMISNENSLTQQTTSSSRLSLIWAATIWRLGRPLIIAPEWPAGGKFSKKYQYVYFWQINLIKQPFLKKINFSSVKTARKTGFSRFSRG